MYLHNHKRSKHQRNDYYYMYKEDRTTAAKYIWTPLSMILITLPVAGSLAIVNRFSTKPNSAELSDRTPIIQTNP